MAQEVAGSRPVTRPTHLFLRHTWSWLSTLGDAAAARDHLLAALSVAQKLNAADPENLEAQRDTAELQFRLAAAYRRLGNNDEARENCAAAIATLERAVEKDPASSETRDLLATARNSCREQ